VGKAGSVHLSAVGAYLDELNDGLIVYGLDYWNKEVRWRLLGYSIRLLNYMHYLLSYCGQTGQKKTKTSNLSTEA